MVLHVGFQTQVLHLTCSILIQDETEQMRIFATPLFQSWFPLQIVHCHSLFALFPQIFTGGMQCGIFATTTTTGACRA